LNGWRDITNLSAIDFHRRIDAGLARRFNQFQCNPFQMAICRLSWLLAYTNSQKWLKKYKLALIGE